MYGSIGKNGNLDIRTHMEQGHQTVPFAQVSLDGDIRIRMMDLDILGLGEEVGKGSIIQYLHYMDNWIDVN